MSDAITQQTVDWCRQHDWGKDAYLACGRVFGLVDEWYDPTTGDVYRGLVDFGSRRKLLTWAGY